MKNVDKILKNKWVIFALILIMLPFVLEITGIYASGKWRYEMTVVVETPEGIKTGSAVRQVSNQATNIKIISFPDAGNPAKFKGESVVVDLGERGLLFTLLEGPPLFYNAFRGTSSGATTVRGIRELNRIPVGKKVTLDESLYSRMVTFIDMDDPKSVVLAKGWRFDVKSQKQVSEDNLEELFGQGIHIKEIIVERTKQPITRTIDQRLVWLKNVRKGSLDGSFAGGGPELSNILHYGNFKKGE